MEFDRLDVSSWFFIFFIFSRFKFGNSFLFLFSPVFCEATMRNEAENRIRKRLAYSGERLRYGRRDNKKRQNKFHKSINFCVVCYNVKTTSDSCSSLRTIFINLDVNFFSSEQNTANENCIRFNLLVGVNIIFSQFFASTKDADLFNFVFSCFTSVSSCIERFHRCVFV